MTKQIFKIIFRALFLLCLIVFGPLFVGLFWAIGKAVPLDAETDSLGWHVRAFGELLGDVAAGRPLI